MSAEVIEGDALEVLAGMAPGRFQCCVCSPPYWGLRDYKIEPSVWRMPELRDCPEPMDCKHEWGAECPGDPRGGSGPNAKEAYGGQDGKEIYARQVPRGQFCQHCGAWRGCLGLEPTPQLYIEHLVSIFREVRRVLRDDGTLWLNMGDCHASKPCGRFNDGGAIFAGRDMTGVASSGAMDKVQASGLKPKDLLMMPARVALALQADGWWLRSAIVWAKGLSFCETYSGSVMPESCRDRPSSAYEMMFMLTKSARYFYDWFAARETGSIPAGTRAAKGSNVRSELKDVNGRPPEYWEYTGVRNWRNVWAIGTEASPLPHYATYPVALAARCIEAGTSPKACGRCGAPWVRVVERGDPDQEHQQACGADASGGYAGRATKDYGAAMAQDPSAVKARILAGMTRDRQTGWQATCECLAQEPGRCIVLDPFCGTGTTGVAAQQLGRDFVGIEISPSYCELARKRLAAPVTEPLFA